MTVHLNLFGGTVLKLGTERHHHLLKGIDKMQPTGCFALTELGKPLCLHRFLTMVGKTSVCPVMLCQS